MSESITAPTTFQERMFARIGGTPMMADFDTLGRLIYEWARNYQSIWEMEVSEEIMPLLQKAGFVELVPYDPALHGSIDDADHGDPIWHWLEPAGCTYPACVDDSLEGKCVRWLTGECSGPTRSRSPMPPTPTPAEPTDA